MNKWIDIKDKQPEFGSIVVALNKLYPNKSPSTCFAVFDGEELIMVDETFGWTEIKSYKEDIPPEHFHHDDGDMVKVSHWMPIPDPSTCTEGEAK